MLCGQHSKVILRALEHMQLIKVPVFGIPTAAPSFLESYLWRIGGLSWIIMWTMVWVVPMGGRTSETGISISY